METLTKYPQETANQLAALFCSKNTLKVTITKPFIQNGLWAVTDARVICTIPADLIEDTTAPDSPKPDLFTVYEKGVAVNFHFSVSEWDALLGEVPEKTLKGIPIVKACPECHGKGEVTCDYCERDHECDTCYGSGEIKTDPLDSPEEKIKDFCIEGSLFSRILLARVVAAAKLLGTPNMGHITALAPNRIMRIEFPNDIVFGVMPKMHTEGVVASPLPILG